MNLNVDIKLDVNQLLKESKFINECDILLAEGLRGLRYATPKVIKFVGDYVRKKVPEQNRIVPDPRILKDVLENISFITDEDLREMFLNLLVSSCDSTKNNLAHPAYALILTQLNQDEAEFIVKLSEAKNLIYENENFFRRINTFSTFENVPDNSTVLQINDNDIIIMHLEHLEHLGVVSVYPASYKQPMVVMGGGAPNKYEGDTFILAKLTSFGELFAQACIPSIPSSSSSGA